MEPKTMDTNRITQRSLLKPFRVISVIPGEAEGVSMIFAKRQAAYLRKEGIVGKLFFLASRTSPSILVKEWQRLRREIKTFKPNLIHANYGSITACFCILPTRLPLVVTYRGSDLNPTPSAPWLRSAVVRFLSQIAALRAKRIICVSDQLKRSLWWRRSRATVIPSGVDLTIFYPRPWDEARSELGWGKKERVILFNAGCHEKVKRLDLAQSAVNVARNYCGEIRFVVLNGYVEPKRIPILMNASDCLLFTSDWEGSPNVVKEALACNLPIVSVDVGDIRVRIAGVRPSKIVARDTNEIGKALAEVLMRGERSNGFETIQKLSLDRITTQILAVYLKALREQ